MKDRKLFGFFFSWSGARSGISNKIFGCICTSEINRTWMLKTLLFCAWTTPEKKIFKWDVSKQPSSNCFHNLSAKIQKGTELHKTCISLNVCILFHSVLLWGRLKRALSRLCLCLLRLFLLLTKYLKFSVIWKPNYLAIHRQGLEDFPV